MQTAPHPFPIPIPAIRSRSVRFQFRFLKSSLVLWQSGLGFLKSEVAGAVSCYDFWNPGYCGALLSAASQLVGNVGFSIILTVFLKVRHKVIGSRIVI